VVLGRATVATLILYEYWGPFFHIRSLCFRDIVNRGKGERGHNYAHLVYRILVIRVNLVDLTTLENLDFKGVGMYC
jgi:hypothetical protein